MTRRYPAYRESGVDWLGEVPAGWAVARIKDNTYLKGRVGWKGLTSDEFEVESFAYLVTGTDFKGKFIDWSTCYQVDEFRYKDDPFIQLKDGDLLITKDGTIGKLAIVEGLDRPACLNSGIFLVRPLHSYETRFLYWVLSSNSFTVFCDLKTYGSTINHLYQNVFENFAFPVPPLPEQTAIAAFLDRETAKIDALVAEQRRLIDLLKEKRQAVISHAVTRGLNPAAKLKPSGVDWLGDVPEGWAVVPLKRVATIQTGVAKGKDTTGIETVEVPYLRVANVQDGYVDLTDVAVIDLPAESLNRYRLKHGDVLMNEGGDFDKLGRGCIWNGEIDPCIHQNHVFAVRPYGVSSEWLNAITSSDYAQFFFMGRSKQSTNLASISSSNLMELPIVVPPPAEQKEVIAFIEQQSAKLKELSTDAEAAINLLQERRAALISAAVTGKIDVRENMTDEVAA